MRTSAGAYCISFDTDVQCAGVKCRVRRGPYDTLHSFTSANMWLEWSSCNIATVCRTISAGIIYVLASFWGCAYSSRVRKAVIRAATLLSFSSTSLSLSLSRGLLSDTPKIRCETLQLTLANARYSCVLNCVGVCGCNVTLSSVSRWGTVCV